MEGQIDAVIGQAVLRKVVRADSFAAVTRSDQCATLGGSFLVQRRLPGFHQPAAEDAHRLGLVLVLALLILNADDDAARDVSDADGRLDLVDLLSAGPAGAHGVDLQVFVADLDVDVGGLGHHGDGGGTGVDATLRFRFGDTLDAMASALELQLVKAAFARDRQHDILQPAQFGDADFEHLELPALLFDVLRVHLEQISGEQRGFVASRAGADFHDEAAARQ